MKTHRIPLWPRLKLVVLALGWQLTLWGQAGEEYPLRPIKPKEEWPAERVLYRSNALDDHGLNRVIEQVAVPTLTVYRAAKPAHRNAAIVICPGGGYQYVVIDREGHMIARYFQQQGITAIVLKYRLPEPGGARNALPRPQQDALAAIQAVRQNATAWGVDAGRVGVLGCSAGGHLAASTAVFGKAEEGTRPDFVALLYPVITLEAPYAHEGSRQKLLGAAATPAQIKDYSLEQRVANGMPPTFLVHARDDQAVPYQNSELFASALEEAGVPAECMLVATGRHGFSLGRDAESARWKEAFLEWLDRVP